MRSELYEWRPVVGYEGLYEVNNLGEVRSLDRTVNCNGGSANLTTPTVKTVGFLGQAQRNRSL